MGECAMQVGFEVLIALNCSYQAQLFWIADLELTKALARRACSAQ
jgi:hypothetical protein